VVWLAAAERGRRSSLTELISLEAFLSSGIAHARNHVDYAKAERLVRISDA